MGSVPPFYHRAGKDGCRLWRMSDAGDPVSGGISVYEYGAGAEEDAWGSGASQCEGNAGHRTAGSVWPGYKGKFWSSGLWNDPPRPSGEYPGAGADLVWGAGDEAP